MKAQRTFQPVALAQFNRHKCWKGLYQQPLYHNEPEEVFLDSALSSSAGHAGDSGDFAQSMSAGEVDLHVLGLDDAATVFSLR